MSFQITFPFQIDRQGRTAGTGRDEHIRQMIEMVLFTNPGERVNRPDFGSGLMQLLFAPNSSELAAATEFMVQGNLQQWLGDLIQVEQVDVSSEEAAIRIHVQYIVRRSGQRETAEFVRKL